ncbi:hypothetical protein J2W95_003269 [Flavobacterium granuli]|uniref:DUF1508 domain-containing protein n=1 Tax=Flavobacterium granuli TaxID=280093 RepID=A0ABU1S677_9FLAO|nr:hypothetical protein [Flavobacterium granuli]
MSFLKYFLRMINVFSSPDGSKYRFVSSSNKTKDIAYSGSEAVMKNYRSAPKKETPAFRPVFFI